MQSTNEWKIDSTPKTALKRLSVSNLKPIPFKLRSGPIQSEITLKPDSEPINQILIQDSPSSVDSYDSDHTFDESGSDVELETFPVSPDISMLSKGPVMMSTPQILGNTLEQMRSQISPETPSKLASNVLDTELNNRLSKLNDTDLTMQEKVYISLLELLGEHKQTRQEIFDKKLKEWYHITD
jgi:hypothetical protein